LLLTLFFPLKPHRRRSRDFLPRGHDVSSAFAIARFLVQFFTRFAAALPRVADVGFFMMCNLQTFYSV
jgi:hypothetical protein